MKGNYNEAIEGVSNAAGKAAESLKNLGGNAAAISASVAAHIPPWLQLKIARQEQRKKDREVLAHLQSRNTIEKLPHLTYRMTKSGRRVPLKPKRVRS